MDHEADTNEKTYGNFHCPSFILTGGFPVLTAKAESPSAEICDGQNSISLIGDSLLPKPEAIPEETLDLSQPETAPAFQARITYSSEGYQVTGSFTEFPPDASLVQTLYSLDGENYRICGEDWNLQWDLHWLGLEENGALERLQNQTCVYSNLEPLKSYLSGALDCFYLKLRITRENGITYESQAAVIDRGSPQPVPEGITASAIFAPSMRVRETRRFRYYGQYQLTVNANAAYEDISAFLPDTVPVEIQFSKGLESFTEGIVHCPVTWKSLSLPSLTAGESITIPDAAEEIIIPNGTLVHTSLGIYQLTEPFCINDYGVSDEIRLVLKVISENDGPSGALSAEPYGLEMAFDLKPTGAAAIKAYIISERDSHWEELSIPQLLEAVNAQPSTANSGYTLILSNEQEPYCTYLASKMETSVTLHAGKTKVTAFVPAAAIAVICTACVICIFLAVGKTTANSRLSPAAKKILHAVHRFLKPGL